MEILLSKQCESLTGVLDRRQGYFIQRRGERFFGQRSKHTVPPDGHWRFILTCARLAQNKLYATDIRVGRLEVANALNEARHFVAAQHLQLAIYHARDIINLQKTFGL
jgi:hypothetical protein